MTRRRDVEAAVSAGADAVGFVVAPVSRRFVPLEGVATLAAGIPVERYLLTVDAEPEWVVAAAVAAGMSGVQPHGANSAATARAALAAGLAVLFPIPVTTATPDLSGVPAGARPLLDTGGSGGHGGTGRPFAWDLAAGLGGEIVIAGGLTPGSVGGAIAACGAWGVDVASGVERSPGIKDPDLMRRFVAATR
jgi:phosphoribosylanthranilate isomerase